MPTRRFTGSGLARRPAVSERLSILDTFCARLAALGATDDELVDVRDAWPSSTEAERAFARDVTDDALRIELARVRSEYVEHTTEDEPGPGHGATGIGSSSLPSRVVDVLAWVGDDVTRARHALDVEWTRPTQRVSLVAELEAKLDGSAA